MEEKRKRIIIITIIALVGWIVFIFFMLKPAGDNYKTEVTERRGRINWHSVSFVDSLGANYNIGFQWADSSNGFERGYVVYRKIPQEEIGGK